MLIASAGHAAFAITLIAIGILGFARGDFLGIWQPVPESWPAREHLAYLCALVATLCGVGVLGKRTAVMAGRVLAGYLLLWLLLIKIPPFFRAPLSQESWSGWGETAVLLAAAWVLYAWFAVDQGNHRLRLTTGVHGIRSAQVLYGLAMIPFGIAHFRYPTQTASLVPRWLPGTWHMALAVLTGSAFILAGVAIVCNVLTAAAASLSALQMGMFTMLVWMPVMMAGSTDASQLSETVISCALTTAGWLVADSARLTAKLRTSAHIQP